MKDLLIFGRSPFISKVKIDKIDYNRFDVLCINYPVPDLRVHYVVSCDREVFPKLAPKTEWISKNTGWELVKNPKLHIFEEKKLSWACYSSSASVHFGILRGYKNIYLIGVDLIEDNKPFEHYDGIVNKKPAKISGCQTEKKCLKECVSYVNLFQCNPLADWLPYRPLKSVYF